MDRRVLVLGTLAVVILLVGVPGAGRRGAAVPVTGPPPQERSAANGPAYLQVANVSITPDPVVVPAGGSLELSATVTPQEPWYVLGGVTISWSLLGASSAGTIQPATGSSVNFQASPGAPSSPAQIEAIATGLVYSLGDAEFQDNVTVPLTVYHPLSLGPLGMQPSVAAAGQTVRLSVLIQGGIPPYSLEWNFGNGNLSSVAVSAPGSVTVTQTYSPGSYQPSVAVWDEGGTREEEQSAAPLQVVAALSVSVEGPEVADVGVPRTFSANVQGGSPPYEISWTDSASQGPVSGQNWTLVPGVPGILSISVSVTDEQGRETRSRPFNLTVAPFPQARLTLETPVADAGLATPLALLLAGGTGPFKVALTAPDSGVSLHETYPTDGNYTLTEVFSQPGPLLINVSVSDGAGANLSQTFVLGHVVPSPSINLSGPDPGPEAGGVWTVTATVHGGVAPYFWQVVPDGPLSPLGPESGTLATSGVLSWSAVVLGAGTLGLDWTVRDSLGDTTSSVLQAQSGEALTVSLTLQPGTLDAGTSATALADVSGGVAPYTYVFTTNEGPGDTGLLSQAGPLLLPVPPAPEGTLFAQIRVTDASGQVRVVNATASILASLVVNLQATPNPVDVGGTTWVHLSLFGGDAPYEISVNLSTGSDWTLSNDNGTALLPLNCPQPGVLGATFRVTDSLGDVAVAQVRVLVNPDLQASLVASAATVDVGAPVTISFNVSGGSAPLGNYTLELGDGNLSHAPVTEHTYLRPGVYTLQGTVEDAAREWIETPTLLVTVVPDPQAAVFLGVAGADAGLATPFLSEVTFGTPPYTYLWNFGDGAESSLPDPSHVYAVPGVYRVTLGVTDSGGESATSPLLAVAVAPEPSLSISANVTRTDVGIPVRLVATGTGGSSPQTITWNFGDGNTASGPLVTHAFGSPGTYTVSAVLTDAAGAQASGTLELVVSPPLRLTGLEEGNGTGEVGVPLRLAATLTGGEPPYTDLWTLATQSWEGSNLSSLEFTPEASGPLAGTVHVSDAVGDTVIATFDLLVRPSLAVNLALEPNAPEAGVPETLEANSSGGEGPIQYSWTLPSGCTVPLGSGPVVDCLFNTSGPAGVTVVARDTLGGVATDNLHVEVAPALHLTLVDGIPPVDAGTPWSAPVLAEGGTGGLTWRVQAGPQVTVLSPETLLFSAPGTYEVEWEATDRSGASSGVLANVTVEPAPNLRLEGPGPFVASGYALLFQAVWQGGAPPVRFRWFDNGVVVDEGASANISFPVPGPVEIQLEASDEAGTTLETNWTAQAGWDPLNLTVISPTPVGMAPFDPSVSVIVDGGHPPFSIQGYLDGALSLSGSSLSGSDLGNWTLPVLSAGPHILNLTVTDDWGARSSQQVTFQGLAPLAPPVVSPDPARATAGEPLLLDARNVSVQNLSSQWVSVHWWGPGIRTSSGSQALFLGDRAGLYEDNVTLLTGAELDVPWENLTLPVFVMVLPGPPVGLVARPLVPLAPAGTNVTVSIRAVDAFGNFNNTVDGPVEILPGPGVEEVPGIPNGTFGSLLDGEAELEVESLRAGPQSYRVQGPLPALGNISLVWTANPSRAVLTIEGIQREGSNLWIRIEASDVYGNPLQNYSVTAQVPGGPSTSGLTENGTLTLYLPGAAGAPEVILTGPDGAQTVARLEPASPSSGAGDELGTGILVALGIASAAGLTYLGWRRSKRSVPPSSPSPGTEAEAVVRHILEQWPDESRTGILLLADEEGIPRAEAGEALNRLVTAGLVVEQPDGAGIPRYHLAPAPEAPEDAGSPGGSAPPSDLTSRRD